MAHHVIRQLISHFIQLNETAGGPAPAVIQFFGRRCVRV